MKWISIKKELPKTGKRILAHDGNDIALVKFCENRTDKWWIDLETNTVHSLQEFPYWAYAKIKKK